MRALPLLTAMLLWGASASADPLLGLKLGATQDEVQAALGAQAQAWPAQSPQALRRGLVDTGLLEELHRAGVQSKDHTPSLKPSSLGTFITARRDNIDYTVVLSASGRLSYLMAQVAVPLASSDPFVKDRLQPRKQALASLKGYELVPATTDAYGNRRAWRGSAGPGRVWVRHVPDQDLLRVLLYRGPRSG